MKPLLFAVTLLVASALTGLLLKITVPMNYAVAELRPDALQHLEQLQAQTRLSALAAAQAYLYFGTDYEASMPSRVQVSEAAVGTDVVRVRFHDPSVQDDSVFESCDRIHLRRDPEGRWQAFKHEWSHKGRGRLGWTTQPTS